MHQREASQGRAHGRRVGRARTAPALTRRLVTLACLPRSGAHSPRPFKPVVMIQRQRIVPSRVMLPEALPSLMVLFSD